MLQIYKRGPPATLVADVSSIYTPPCSGGRGYIRELLENVLVPVASVLRMLGSSTRGNRQMQQGIVRIMEEGQVDSIRCG